MAGIDVLVVTHRAGAPDRCLGALSAQHTAPRRTQVVSSDVSVTVPPGVDVLRTDGPSTLRLRQTLAIRHGRAPRGAPGRHHPSSSVHRRAGARAAQEFTSPASCCPTDASTTPVTGFSGWTNVARGRGTTPPTSPTAGAFSGAAVCFTPEVLETVGLFDAEFGAYGEDLDLSLRAVRMGFLIRYVPAAEVTHELGATYGRTTPKTYRVERNRTQAAIRSLPAAAVLAMPATATVRGPSWESRLRAARTRSVSGNPRRTAAVAGAVSGAAAAPAALSKRRRDRGQWTVDDAGMWRHLWRQGAPRGKLSGEGLSEP